MVNTLLDSWAGMTRLARIKFLGFKPVSGEGRGGLLHYWVGFGVGNLS